MNGCDVLLHILQDAYVAVGNFASTIMPPGHVWDSKVLAPVLRVWISESSMLSHIQIVIKGYEVNRVSAMENLSEDAPLDPLMNLILTKGLHERWKQLFNHKTSLYDHEDMRLLEWLARMKQ